MSWQPRHSSGLGSKALQKILELLLWFLSHLRQIISSLTMIIFPLECAARLQNMGLLIKQRRLERKIRQKDLAAQTGLSTTTLGKIEAGTPTVEMRGYMIVLWHLGLLDDAFTNPELPPIARHATEHRVRVKRISEDDF